MDRVYLGTVSIFIAGYLGWARMSRIRITDEMVVKGAMAVGFKESAFGYEHTRKILEAALGPLSERRKGERRVLGLHPRAEASPEVPTGGDAVLPIDVTQAGLWAFYRDIGGSQWTHEERHREAARAFSVMKQFGGTPGNEDLLENVGLSAFWGNSKPHSNWTTNERLHIMRLYVAMTNKLPAQKDRALNLLKHAIDALREFVYETTHLSPLEGDGSHKCRISAATLAKGRMVLDQYSDRPGEAIATASTPTAQAGQQIKSTPWSSAMDGK